MQQVNYFFWTYNKKLDIEFYLIHCIEFRLLGNDNVSFVDFINEEQAELLTHYISYVQCERYSREFQCMYGIQMMSVAFKYPRGEFFNYFIPCALYNMNLFSC